MGYHGSYEYRVGLHQISKQHPEWFCSETIDHAVPGPRNQPQRYVQVRCGNYMGPGKTKCPIHTQEDDDVRP